MKIEGNTFRLVKLISTLLPEYIFGEPRNTVMGTYLPIYTALKCNDEFRNIISDQYLRMSDHCIGYFVIWCVGIRDTKTFTILGSPIGSQFFVESILNKWETIGIKHSLYQKVCDPDLNNSGGYVYYKLWLDDDENQ